VIIDFSLNIKMAKGSSEKTITDVEHNHHQAHWHINPPFKYLVRPDGKKVYVAGNPLEASELRRALSEHDSDAEFVVHGSDEHLNTLRHVYSHHQEQRSAFYKRHGEHFTELEKAIRDMDTVREELHSLEERVIQLDTVAAKYGYDSHVRLRDQPGSCKPALSGHAVDFEKERRNAQSMSFFKKPQLRQYYHKGLLWRTNELHEAGPYELFVDLVYVGIIAIAGDAASQKATWRSLLRFAVTFLLGWKFWTEIVLYMAWFIQEDVVRRLSVIFVLVCLVGLTVNMEGFFGNTYTALVAFYVTAGLMSGFSWLYYAAMMKMIRNTLISNGVFLIVSAVLWIGSIHDHTSGRYVLIWMGLFLDILGFELKWILILHGLKSQNARVKAWFAKNFEFIPAVSVEHMVSRFDSFVTLVLGYSVVSLLYQSATANPLNNFFAKAILGLLQAFAVNTLYFEIDSFNLYTHAIRRHNRVYLIVWKMTHIPFVMSFVVAGATISRLVLAHDCHHCPINALGEAYGAKSQASISQGQRWFYCAGLGIATICTAIIASTHAYKQPEGSWFSRHRKNLRLVLRGVVGLVIMLLPLARDKLDSVTLIGTTAGLLHFCLFSDILGNMLDMRLCPTMKNNAPAAKPHIVQVP
jgi:low temperature requirement protein LtrA